MLHPAVGMQQVDADARVHRHQHLQHGPAVGAAGVAGKHGAGGGQRLRRVVLHLRPMGHDVPRQAMRQALRAGVVLLHAHTWFQDQAASSAVFAEAVTARGYTTADACGYGVGFAPATWAVSTAGAT